MIVIRLTAPELSMGAWVGQARHVASLAKGDKEAYGSKRDASEGGPWQKHINGACGEIAVAKLLNRYWSGHVNTYGTVADIGKRIEVRTRSEGWHDLIIRPKDEADRLYVLATGTGPSYTIVGWIRGGDAKSNADWIQTHGDRDPAWFVPQRNLIPIDPITDLLAAEDAE